MTVLPVALPARTTASDIFPGLARLACVLAGYCLLTALLFWPVLPHLSSALLGPPEDNLQDFWNSFYATQPHPDGFFFTRMIRFPEGAALNYHSFAWPQVFAVAALARLSGTDFPTLVLLQNLTLLASFPLAGLGAFLLCRHLSGSVMGGLAGGFLFAFNPAHVAQTMHHAHVAGIQFIPFFVWCYLIALEKQSRAWLAGAVVFYGLSALSSWYYLFFILYFMAFHLLYLRVRHHAWPRGWALAAPVLCVAGTVALLSPLLAPMLMDGLKAGAYYPGSNTFVADLLAYGAFPPAHLLAPLGKGVHDAMTSNVWEGTVYLGLVNLAVLAVALRKAKDGDRRMLFYALGGMIFFCVLAGGDALHVGGWVSPIHLPGIVLSKLPFFGNVRTPARAIVFVYLFLAVAIAVAVAMVERTRPGAAARAGLALAALLMVMDFLPARLETTPVACVPALRTIAVDPDRDFGVLDLPGGYENGNFAMMQQACHGRPIAQGETSRRLTASAADRLEIRDFAAQKRQLADARIKYIVLHHPMGPLFAWNRNSDGPREKYRQAYPAVYDDTMMTVLRVY